MRTAKLNLYKFLVLIGAALLLVAPVVIAKSTQTAQQRIRSALAGWMAAFNAGDFRHICDLFAADLIANYQGQPERNHDSLCKLLHGSLSDRQRKFHYSLEIKEILVSGDLAAVRLVWTLGVVAKNGSETRIVEPGLDIFRRQDDGSWKISRFIAYDASR